MDTHRKQAKKFFKESTKTEYNILITEAYLTNRQQEIALLKKEDTPTWEIANILHVSPETITRELARIYDKISKVTK